MLKVRQTERVYKSCEMVLMILPNSNFNFHALTILYIFSSWY